MKIVTTRHGHEWDEKQQRWLSAWSAVDDHTYDGAPDAHCPVGWGHTEEAAIDDLVEQIVDELEELIESARYERDCLKAENEAFRVRSAQTPSETLRQDARGGASDEKVIPTYRGSGCEVTTGLLDGFAPLDWFEGPAETRCQGRMADEPEDR